MPRTAIAVTKLAGTVNPPSADLTLTAGDSINDHDWDLADGDILLVRNTDVAAQVATLVSIADSQGRIGDEAKSVAAGAIAIFGPLKREGWLQAGGKAHLDLANDNFELAILRL